MKNMLAILGILAAAGAHAQTIGPSTLNAGGTSQTIAGNLYEGSIAEMTLVNTYTSPTLVLTQGLLQPLPPSTGINTVVSLSSMVMLYPNPVVDELFVQCDFIQGGKLQYTVNDMTGKVILQQETSLTNGKEKVAMRLAEMATGNYMLQLVYTQASGTSAASYKIIKAK